VKVALTGGIASGKSTVAALLAAFGAVSIDFDVLARKAVEPGAKGFEEVCELFQNKVLRPDGSLDRALIAQKVFKDSGLRLALEAIIHPIAWRLMLQELQDFGDEPLVVIEVPLLFEAALAGLFYPVALSYTSPETQLKRLLYRNPDLGSRKAKKILKAQWPMGEKLRRSNLIINNEDSLADLIRRTKEIWNQLTSGKWS
jgi:dephospho-CoA kinase